MPLIGCTQPLLSITGTLCCGWWLMNLGVCGHVQWRCITHKAYNGTQYDAAHLKNAPDEGRHHSVLLWPGFASQRSQDKLFNAETAHNSLEGTTLSQLLPRQYPVKMCRTLLAKQANAAARSLLQAVLTAKHRDLWVRPLSSLSEPANVSLLPSTKAPSQPVPIYAWPCDSLYFMSRVQQAPSCLSPGVLHAHSTDGSTCQAGITCPCMALLGQPGGV